MTGSETPSAPGRVEVALPNVKEVVCGSILIGAGLTVLVGPNGSGKTRALRTIKNFFINHLDAAQSQQKVRYLAAGRSSPFEAYRASVKGPHHLESDDAAVGHVSYRRSWWQDESLTGDLLALDHRPDLKLKVEARLQQLFDRSIELTWTQSGLTPRISPMTGGTPYAVNHEASGILHLVGLLAAIYNDEIDVLIVDEPEISLHPQHQAFVLNEMERVAGDFSEPGKKVIVIATHAPSFLPLRSTADLPRIAFFNEVGQPPTQMDPQNPILGNKKLGALIARLSATHRMAMFAQRVLLVEGPSDEIIATQLAHRLDLPLLARNAEILPVTGKGEFVEVSKLFALMNKSAAVLADLDALADDNSLVNYFSVHQHASVIANRQGAESIAAMDSSLRNALSAFIEKYPDEVTSAAADYPPWSDGDDAAKRNKRHTLARVLTAPETFAPALVPEATSLSLRYRVLLDILAEVGCFILQAGAIENYYLPSTTALPKPAQAAGEAATFWDADLNTLQSRFDPVLKAIRYIAPARGVDETLILRPKLGAAIAALFQSMSADTPDPELTVVARAHAGTAADLFAFENISSGSQLKLRVSFSSSLFDSSGFPFEIAHGENVNIVLPSVLPSNAF